MNNEPKLRAAVVRSKAILADGREKLRRQHESGSPGVQVCNRMTDLLDEILLVLLQSILEDLGEIGEQGIMNSIALLRQGSYGRRDMAPFSDVDLMLLHPDSLEERVEKVAQRLSTDVADVGLTFGFGVRTPKQAIQMARGKPAIFTSQAESRLLVGNQQIFDRFMRQFRRNVERWSGSYITRMEQSRRDERAQYGDTVFLLEPNIKRSSGALRDLHLLRWVGFARYGESDPDNLRLKGQLSKEDSRSLRKALEYLLRLRNELHFHAGRPYDVLYRAEQVRIAEKWNYAGSESLLPVEQFMSEYFRHTRNIRAVARHFRASARRRSSIARAFAPLVTNRYEGDFTIGPYHISTTRRGRKKLVGNLAEVLRLMDIANQTGKLIEHDTWNAIRDDFMRRSDVEVTDEAAKRFLSLLSYTARLGSLLRRLHEVGVLEKLVSGMHHARRLLQFNRYHKYTVDEHCIRSVEQATGFQTAEGSLGRVYRRIKNRSILHLALLIHDLGKGLPGDHSDVGAELALQTAAKLRLSRRDTETLRFLVQDHLVMSHLAFRRDTSDESLILNFAAATGSPEKLKMLFVLTAADLAAVGPDVLNLWKIEILTDLYRRTNFHLKGGDTMSDSVVMRITDQREKVLQCVPGDDAEWYEKQVSALPPSYLTENPPAGIIEDLGRLRQLPIDKAVAWGRYVPDRRVSEYTVGLHETKTLGVFHRLTGALTGQRLKILSASIQTLADGLILDRFCVEDPDFQGPPPPLRIEEVGRALVEAVDASSDKRPVFRRTWKPSTDRPDAALEYLPARVVIDSTTLPDCTIIDVFAHDRLGLLYTITRTLYELNLSVKYAKIGTYLDQVVDVFYVTDLEGRKLDDESRLERIRDELLRQIETTETSRAFDRS